MLTVLSHFLHSLSRRSVNFVLHFRMLSNLSSATYSWAMIPQTCCVDGYNIEICMYYHPDKSKHLMIVTD